MHIDFWIERWQQNQIGFHDENINRYLQTYWVDFPILYQQQVFVPLCGKSNDLIWLRDQGFEVIAVELSPLAIANFFSDNNLQFNLTEYEHQKCWESENLRIYEGDFFKLSQAELGECCFVYDRAALVALPPDMRRLYAQHLQTILPSVKEMLLICFEYDQQEMSGPPFSVYIDEIQQLYGETLTIECLAEEDGLDLYPEFKERGLSQLKEKIYRVLINNLSSA